MEIENEDLSKKIENISMPNLETLKHKARLRAVLLDSDRFQEKPQFFWFGKLAMVGLSGVFILFVFFGSEALFLREFNHKGIVVPEKNPELLPEYSNRPEKEMNNVAPDDYNPNLPVNNEEKKDNNSIAPNAPITVTPAPSVSRIENSQILENTIADWNTYQNAGYGYEIQLPKSWSFGAVEEKDGLGGSSGNVNFTEKWTIEPAPVFEVTPENRPDLIWLIKDESGNIKLQINTELKTKLGNVSLEKFADDYFTPKDKMTVLTSVRMNFGSNDAIRRDLQISDPAYSGRVYYFSSDKYFYVFRTRGVVDPVLTDEIISKIKFIK